MVNGAPSPDIAGTVNGGEWGTIEEIQFVGMVMSPMIKNNDDDETIDIKQKRICKIKCLNGVWIGPFCAFQTGKSMIKIFVSSESKARKISSIKVNN